ncbi:hypothetical protein FIBSPDRAFT_102113 [Athelia psychrophila]|uniref:Uncharacterized protein n=1 Tax=Athelia psychrophila TaxID=1759441 RepID=A0A166DHM5_9AGAM|nr:hypothetical protein FIBSPDRAFT_102113 [Fibularhizoctonia sp. CBS 109695]
MSQAGHLAESGLRDNAITLLRLAEAIPPDSFPTFKGLATISLALVVAVAKFKSNRKIWANFGDHVQKTAAGLIHYICDLDKLETREAAKYKMEKVLEVLNAIQKEIYQLQRLHPLRRVVVYKKDPETIADMKKRLDAAMMSFPLAAQSDYEGRDPRRLLETILEKYGDTSQHLDANRSPVASRSVASPSQMPALVFNTSSTSDGRVTNVAGDYTVNGLDETRLGQCAQRP